uniref:Secreted protein n=1 Tax=Macrostomum lignano TaxID=282301 RepID=A0A1I8IRX4_9PLAT
MRRKPSGRRTIIFDVAVLIIAESSAAGHVDSDTVFIVKVFVVFVDASGGSSGGGSGSGGCRSRFLVVVLVVLVWPVARHPEVPKVAAAAVVVISAVAAAAEKRLALLAGWAAVGQPSGQRPPVEQRRRPRLPQRTKESPAHCGCSVNK